MGRPLFVLICNIYELFDFKQNRSCFWRFFLQIVPIDSVHRVVYLFTLLFFDEIWQGDPQGSPGLPVWSHYVITHFDRKEWEEYWMDYKQFKIIIAEIDKEKKEKLSHLAQVSETDPKKEDAEEIDISKISVPTSLSASLEKEKQFFRELTESVIMVDNFFNQIQVQYIVEVKQLIEEVKKVDSVCIYFILNKQCPKEKLEETIESLLESCRVIHGKLLLLEMYAHVNYCGFTKITKKHDRVTGYATQKKYMQKKVNVAKFSSFTLYFSRYLFTLGYAILFELWRINILSYRSVCHTLRRFHR